MGGLSELGLAGLFIGSFLAATVIPFSSDFLIVAALLAGCDATGVFLCATLGSFLGSVSSYWLGYIGKWSWLERWFKVRRETLERQQRKVEKWGAPLALLAWLPFVGDLFSIALGFYKVTFWKAALYTFIGKAMRSALWVFLYLRYGDIFLNLIKGL